MSAEQMSISQPVSAAPVWRPSIFLIGLVAMMLLLSIVPFSHELYLMWGWWMDRPEYSHGVLMPVIAMFLAWQQRDHLERQPFSNSWWGVALTVFGAILLLIGKLGSVVVLVQYAYVFSLGGLMLSLVGLRSARYLIVPFVILVLMIPMPEFILRNLTAELQLISSKLGVAFIRLCHVSVYLEGNVIDLGVQKLEVAEACSGLRYLFPLMTLGFIMAYIFKAAMWKRAVVFLSSIPVTILMNSLRIGVIGVMVDRWGKAMAEGTLHDFEGWIIFMASAAVLLVEIILLNRIGAGRRPWRDVFGFELPAAVPSTVARIKWQPTRSFIISSALVVLLAVISIVLPERMEKIPMRSSFAEFPLNIDNWSGVRTGMETVYLNQLKLDDYLLANFTRPGQQPISSYVAWYNSQRGGESSHSPRTCLPGGGWQINSLQQVLIPGVTVNGGEMSVNRAIISSGTNRQLVYYWFQQRGRVITNEYMVKWYLFWDALTQRRTDGALVRLIVSVPDDGSTEQIESQLNEFTRNFVPKLTPFIPE